MIKAIIFDVDGVMIDQELFTVRLLKDYGIELEKTIPFIKGTFNDCQVGKKDLKVELSKIIDDWGWKRSVDDLINYWFLGADINLNEELIHKIYELSKNDITCCIGTNQERYRGEFIKEILGYNKLFQKYFTSYEIGYKKPEFKYFDYIINSLRDYNKKEVLFIDSDEEIVESAREYGITSEVYSSSINLNKYLK